MALSTYRHRSLIAELEDAVRRGSQEKRVETLRRVTDLFLVGSKKLNEEQIQVFDEVLGHLITRMESKALIELSERLAPVNNAPINVVNTLARDDRRAGFVLVGPPDDRRSHRNCPGEKPGAFAGNLQTKQPRRVPHRHPDRARRRAGHPQSR